MYLLIWAMSRWSQFHELTGAAFYYKSEINVSPGQVLTGLELSLLKTLPQPQEPRWGRID